MERNGWLVSAREDEGGVVARRNIGPHEKKKESSPEDDIFGWVLRTFSFL